MDIATLIGIIFGLGAIVGSILLMTPDMGMFVSASSFGIVFGGMLASVAVAFPLKDVLQLGTAIGAVFKGGRDTLGGLVDEAVDAAEAMQLGCDGVLVNTAIAKAKKPLLMAEAMKLAVIAGRKSYLSGRIKKTIMGKSSSPKKGII